ncbi:hypothetical protein BDV19DRAFT_384813 [Aspergillus venezuelensis]
MLALTTGGCLCVPSDHDRSSNLADALTNLQANWAVLTFSVARILNPARTYTLKHLVLCGESPLATDLQRWSLSPSGVQVMVSYGPAECAVGVTLQSGIFSTSVPRVIGRADCAATWIVDSQDHERLAPIGAVGELLVEGHIVGQGYCHDPEKTAAAFIEQPQWLGQFRQTALPLYKTGDLVQYVDDGSAFLRYVGRKDRQVKIRGQRVELKEVELHVRKCFTGVSNAVADIIFTGANRQSLLATWITTTELRGEGNSDESEGSTQYGSVVLAQHGAKFQEMVNQAERRLQKVVPNVVVPDIFIPILAMPLTLTGKIDRRRLRSWTTGLSSDILYALRLPDAIGLNDHFFRRGGNSLLAMRLAVLAREVGLSITVADIFLRPRLSDLADEKTVGTALSVSEQEVPEAFALLPFDEAKEEIISAVVARGQLDRDGIEDIYPCTPMQDGLMALALKTPGQYVATWDYTLRDDLDLEKLQQAFAATVTANPILRTRMIYCHPHGSFQLVLRDNPVRIPVYPTHEDCEEDRRSHAAQMGFENPLWRAGIILDRPVPRLVLTIHHVLYDGESLSLIWDQVRVAYESANPKPLPLRPFASFIRYIAESIGAASFLPIPAAGS